MSKTITSFVGLDAHVDSIAIGVAPRGRQEPHSVGTVSPQWGSLSKALSRLGKPEALRIVYEAGSCGHTLARQLGRPQPKVCNLNAIPLLLPCREVPAQLKALNVDSKAKSVRAAAYRVASFTRTRPAAIAAPPGLRGAKPCAIKSAFTN